MVLTFCQLRLLLKHSTELIAHDLDERGLVVVADICEPLLELPYHQLIEESVSIALCARLFLSGSSVFNASSSRGLLGSGH